MSQANVETYLRGVAGLNARQFSDGLFAEFATSEFRIENTSTAVTDKTYHGAQGLREWRSDLFEAFGDETRYENVKSSPTGDDFVVSLVRLKTNVATIGCSTSYPSCRLPLRPTLGDPPGRIVSEIVAHVADAPSSASTSAKSDLVRGAAATRALHDAPTLLDEPRKA